MNTKREQRHRRHKKIRAKVLGNAKRPRFSVFRSNQYIYGQLIDDEKGHTLIRGSDLDFKKLKNQSLKLKKNKKETKIDLAYKVGGLIAKEALKKGIKKAVFDRGGYKYHGRIKAIAEGARKEGLSF